jgi:hypothetical protein
LRPLQVWPQPCSLARMRWAASIVIVAASTGDDVAEKIVKAVKV